MQQSWSTNLWSQERRRAELWFVSETTERTLTYARRDPLRTILELTHGESSSYRGVSRGRMVERIGDECLRARVFMLWAKHEQAGVKEATKEGGGDVS